MLKTFFSELGLNVSLMVAGAAGAFINFNRQKRLPFWERIFMIVSGALSASYLAPMVIEWLSISKQEETYGIAFLIGFGGLKSAEALYDTVIDFIKSRA